VEHPTSDEVASALHEHYEDAQLQQAALDKEVERASGNVTFFLALCIVLGLVSFYTVYPFFNLVLASAFLAYLFHPLEKAFSSKVGKRDISIFFIAVFISVSALIMLVYSIFILNQIFQHGSEFYEVNKEELIGKANHLIDTVEMRTGADLGINVTTIRIGEYINEAVSSEAVTENLLGSLAELSNLFFALLLIMFLTYYFLLDGENALMGMVLMFPSEKVGMVQEFLGETDRMARGVIFSHFSLSFLIGVVSFPGYVAIGYGDPLLLAVVTTIVALVPIIGGSLVPFVLALFNFASFEWRTGIELLLLAIILTIVSQMMYAWVSRKTDTLHPFYLLLGMISGPFVYGITGFFIGPIILGAFANAVEIYGKSLREKRDLTMWRDHAAAQTAFQTANESHKKKKSTADKSKTRPKKKA
jgi:predicted PurR-regulated permease PerM